MKRPTLILLLLTAALLSSSAVVWVYANQDIVWLADAKQTIPYHFTVDEQVGVDVATDRFRLGAVTEGSTNRRSLFLSAEGMRQARIRVTGDGRGLLRPENATVPLQNGSAEVEFRVSVPEGAPMGEYEGDIVVYFLREPIVNN